MATLQICPPAYDTSLEWPQSLVRPRLPASLSTQISFADYHRMHCEQHDSRAVCQRPAEPWAMSDERLLEVVVFALERRAYINLRQPQPGTIRERLIRVHQKLAAREPELLVILDRLLAEHHGERDRKRREVLAREIATVDGNIVTNSRAFEITLGCARRAWRLGENSTEIGQGLGIRPQTARQILYRLRQVRNDIVLAEVRGWSAPALTGRRTAEQCDRDRRAWATRRARQARALQPGYQRHII